MNKILKFTLFVLIIVITGCLNNKSKEVQLGNKSEIIINSDYVTIKVREESLNKTGAIFILENHTDNSYGYGYPYFLEKEKNGVWYQIKPINDPAFILPSLELEPRKSIEIKIEWEYIYGRLEIGKYRVVKDVNNEVDETVYIAAEFLIK